MLKLVWLETRDLHTRSKMVELLRMSCPQGEALAKAQAESELLWNSFSQMPAMPSPDVQPESASPVEASRKDRTVNDCNGKSICKKRSDNRG